MKNKGLYIVAALMLLTVGFTSCEKKSKDKTSITYYANLEMTGSDVIGVNLGTSYVEPGYKATMNGQDVTKDVIVNSNIDTSKKGVYSISYNITNADGFVSSASRTVVVYDFSDPVEGIWYTSPTSYRVYSSTAAFGGRYYTLVWNNGDGSYEVEDLFGGWYAQRAGYGSDYAMDGNISIAADGTITMIDSYLIGWGDSAEALNNGQYDAATNTMYFEVVYNGNTMFFYITLIKAEF